MQLRKLLLATGNPGKTEELRVALVGLQWEIVSARDLASDVASGMPIESGMTYAENAIIKAEYWQRMTGLAVLADDSGIIVDALAGELGVATRRWGAGEAASDREWLDYFLTRMRDVPQDQRTAEFVCVLALALDGGGSDAVLTFTGRVQGVITTDIEAPLKPGIPLSSVFQPLGSDKVFAAMSDAEKNRFSHRGRALHALKQFLLTPHTR